MSQTLEVKACIFDFDAHPYRNHRHLSGKCWNFTYNISKKRKKKKRGQLEAREAVLEFELLQKTLAS